MPMCNLHVNTLQTHVIKLTINYTHRVMTTKPVLHGLMTPWIYLLTILGDSDHQSQTKKHQHWLLSDGSQFKGHLTVTFKHICYRKICVSFCTEPLQSAEVFCFHLFLQQSDSADTFYNFSLKKNQTNNKTHKPKQ